MIEKITYGSLINYSPKGQSDLSKRSRFTCGAIKSCKPAYIANISESLKREEAKALLDLLNMDRILVPIPRSGLLKEDTIWPSMIIAEELLAHGFGKSIEPILSRQIPIIKSSQQIGADNRPSVQEQIESLLVKEELFLHNKITLIDDVMTLGRTSYACAQKIHEAYPDSDISLFSVVRTQGIIKDIEAIFDPSIGEISYNENTGKTNRQP